MNVINPYRLDAWTPDRLGDTLGLWIDASNLSTLYSDLNLLLPLTSQGSCGSVADVRGIAGYQHIAAPTTANRTTTLDPSTAINGLNTIVFEDASVSTIANNPEMQTSGFPMGTPGTLATEPIGFWYVGTATWETITADGTGALRGTFIQQQGGRLIMHVPWTVGNAFFDVGILSPPGGSQANRVFLPGGTIGGPDAPENVIVSAYATQANNGDIFYVKINGSGDPANPTGPNWIKPAAPSPSVLGSFIKLGFAGMPQGFNLGEMLFTKGVIDDVDRNKIEGYLAHKWGLTSLLPTTGYTNENYDGGPNPHPYKINSPTA